MSNENYVCGQYREALARFAIPKHRDEESKNLTYWGAAAGLSAEDIIADAAAAGVVGREYELKIRHGYETAKPKIEARRARFEAEGAACHRAGRVAFRSVLNKPAQIKGGRVQRLIEEGRDIDDMEKLRKLSAAKICPGEDLLALRVSREQELLTLFAPNEFLFMRSGKASNEMARLGDNLCLLDKWLDPPLSTTLGDRFEVVGVNPRTGRAGASGSFGTKDTIAAFRHMVWEFDEMPLADQCRFWAGVIRRGDFPLVALVYSGNKSIHGVIRVPAKYEKTAEGYRAFADAIAARYANPADPPQFRLDVQALRNALICVRLAGVVRKDTGKNQALLYAARHWFDREYEDLMNPPEAEADETANAEAVKVGADQAAAPVLPTTTSGADNLARRCVECNVSADCKEAFAAFWQERAHGGVGCNNPFGGWDEARQIVADLKRQAEIDRSKRKHQAR